MGRPTQEIADNSGGKAAFFLVPADPWSPFPLPQPGDTCNVGRKGEGARWTPARRAAKGRQAQAPRAPPRW